MGHESTVSGVSRWPTLALAFALALPASWVSACAVAKPAVLAMASPEAAELGLLLDFGGDRLGPETAAALEQTLVGAGYRVTRNASDDHDAVLRLRVSGEEVQSPFQMYENGQLQRTYRVTGSLSVVEGPGPKEGTNVTLVPVDFECKNEVIGRAEVTPLANALGANPMFVALGKRVKFDRSLEEDRARRGAPPEGAGSAEVAPAPAPAP